MQSGLARKDKGTLTEEHGPQSAREELQAVRAELQVLLNLFLAPAQFPDVRSGHERCHSPCLASCSFRFALVSSP